MNSPKRLGIALLVIAASVVAAAPAEATARHRCPNDRNPDAATWFSIAHPGLGEFYLNGWGPFFDNAPQKKFWLGFIPLYGWPGYLQVKSAIDAHNCRVNDDL